MRRASLAAAVAVSVCCLPSTANAQAPAVPEGWVVLPVDEYRALRERAVPSPPSPIPPAIDATITRLDYDLRTDAESVIGRVLLTVDVLRDGWTALRRSPPWRTPMAALSCQAWHQRP